MTLCEPSCTSDPGAGPRKILVLISLENRWSRYLQLIRHRCDKRKRGKKSKTYGLLFFLQGKKRKQMFSSFFAVWLITYSGQDWMAGVGMRIQLQLTLLTITEFDGQMKHLCLFSISYSNRVTDVCKYCEKRDKRKVIILHCASIDSLSLSWFASRLPFHWLFSSSIWQWFRFDWCQFRLACWQLAKKENNSTNYEVIHWAWFI